MSKEFDVVRDAPKTPEQALAVLESWAGNLAVTFSRERCGYVVDALKSSSDELKFLAFEELKGKEPIKGLEADPSAFVRWAEKAGYDMTCHPLHFLFLDQKTNAARMGWKAAVEHYNPQPAQPKEPLDMPLPCDVTVGHVTIRKNVSLRTLVGRMQILHDMAQQAPVHCERCAEMGYEQPKREPLTDDELDAKLRPTIQKICRHHGILNGVLEADLSVALSKYANGIKGEV